MFFVYINLDDRILKRKHMNAMLKSMELNFKRFQAIRPSKEDVIGMERMTERLCNYLQTERLVERGLGILGCYLSHFRVLEKYSDIKNKYMCILEDDVEFDNHSLHLMHQTIKFFEKNNIEWDMLRAVNGFTKLKGPKLFNDKIFKFCNCNVQSRPTTKPYEMIEVKMKPSPEKNNFFCGGTHFQVINMKNVKRILDYLNNEPVYNIDSVYSTNKINVFAVSGDDYKIKLHEEYRNHSDIPKTR